MKTFFYLLGIIILLSSCNMMKQNDKNDKFYLDDSHLKDENILNEKKQVIEFLKAFNEWYLKAGAEIQWYEGWSMVGYESLIEDEFRIDYIKTTVFKEVEKTDILTKRLKDKILNDIKIKEDPENLGTLILENKKHFGKEFYCFTKFDEPFLLAQYDGFNLNSNEMEGTYEEAEKYYLKMISLGEVIKYNIPYAIIGFSDNYYVNVFIIKEDRYYKVDKIEVKPFEKDEN
jgi:hypothetical protein